VPRLATITAALVLALPGSALAQGAGDDQYQDPFGDQTQTQTGDGLTESPNVGGNSGSGSSSGSASSGSSGSSGSGSAGTTTTAPAAPATTTPAAGAGEGLPNTGTDPRILVLLGCAFVLTGAGLRLRTIDPDAF
jgi:hypothetical protein